MGNSTGNMQDYWDMFRSSPRIIGGCIWDYKDQGLLKTDEKGNQYYAYGGDFGEKLHDSNFCINGIVASDGRPKAAMFECKRVYQPVWCEFVQPDKIKIMNRHSVKNLSCYTVALKFSEDGYVISSVQLPSLDLCAGQDTTLNISEHLPNMNTENEYLADIHFMLKEEKPWAPAGFEIASNQFVLTPVPETYPKRQNFLPVKVEQDENNITVSGKGFIIAFSTKNGALVSYLKNGVEQIYSPLLPHFTRPQTDNDERGWKPQRVLNEWYEAKPELKNMQVQEAKSGLVRIESEYSVIPDRAKATVVYLVNGDGLIKVFYSLNADLD